MTADKKGPRKEKEESKSDLEEKVVYINRCAKVVKGGRKFSFSALVIVGDRKSRIGVGFAKAVEVPDAIRKASESARKSLFQVEIENNTIPHEVSERADGAHVMLKPARPGTGNVAGSHVRSMLELAGIQDCVAKNLGSTNAGNQVRATLLAFKKLTNRKKSLALRFGES
ncbi:MAG: 30S ribosomal protein S5 [Chlamydiae bacterium]|nr:30S ribosomal protein S5 [Chlamydiota bacterium]